MFSKGISQIDFFFSFESIIKLQILEKKCSTKHTKSVRPGFDCNA